MSAQERPVTLRPMTSRPVTLRPITVLIAALGGEGGGVLTDWIIAAAAHRGLPVQSTSIPGVAQRTGATTYYIEVFPTPARELGGLRPVMALSPGIGDVDIVVASELLEAGRTVAAGFVTPDRTLAIASTHRAHSIAEKMAMGDGRLDPDKLVREVVKNARSAALFDMDAVARRAGAMINAVMLGAIAASGRLPMAVEDFEAAIRADGKAVEANLRGFAAGLAAAQQGAVALSGDAAAKTRAAAADTLADLEAQAARLAGAADIVVEGLVVEGLRRLAAYQDIAYAGLYLARLRPIAQADARAQAEGRLLRETARHLAVRMSYEDVIRVAQAKIAPDRIARIVANAGGKPGEPVAIIEFLKPGIEEICQLLPPRLATAILRLAERRGWTGRFHWGMEIKTTSITGYLRFLLLAKLRRFRPRTYRFGEEQAAIEAWLGLIAAASAKSAALALEIAECARLIKGYGDTWKRGAANYAAIEARVIRPVLAGRMAVARGIDAIASARTAALLDPDGEGLARCLADIERSPGLGVAAE
jgi:indolepyruvate ferredoxin oxidoreductase beta subunit